MFEFDREFDRRDVLRGSAAMAGAAALLGSPLSALAASYPARNIQVFVPTRAGGGADRNLRAFTSVWKNYLKTNFEPKFYPGAAGRVGYETYMGKGGDDGHDLLFGNMGPEVLNWVVKKPKFDLDDFMYFAAVDWDPGIIFLSRKGKIKNIDELVAEGKKRTVNIGVSRLAHPASLGALALARHTGAKFNLVPLSGGRNTRAGVATGEVDAGALPSGGIVNRAKNFKVALVFADKNPLPGRTENAPTCNAHFGTNLPPLIAGARAFGVKKAFARKHPDRMKLLTETAQKVFQDPAYKKAVVKTKAPWELIQYRGPEACAAYAKAITAIGVEYKDLLTGKS